MLAILVFLLFTFFIGWGIVLLMHGSPWLRLLRREVEALAKKELGENHLKGQQAKTELASINRELKRLRAQVAALEERRAKLVAEVGR